MNTDLYQFCTVLQSPPPPLTAPGLRIVVVVMAAGPAQKFGNKFNKKLI